MLMQRAQQRVLNVPSLIFGAVLVALVSTGSAQAGDIFKGKSLYRLHCLSCHGERGRPIMPGAPYLSRGEGLMQSDHALLNVLRLGKDLHPGYKGVLNDQEIFDVISFIRTLF